MTFSNRGNNNFSGGQNYTRRDFNDRGSDRPTMFDAVCAQCGVACKVPFKPNGRKEVFCSKCFENNGGGSRETSFGESRRPQMFRATCDQCGQNCDVPFRPTNGKPVLCSKCFADTKSHFSRSNNRENTRYPVFGKDYSAELEEINTKLDRILKLLVPTTTKEPSKEITTKILAEIETNLEKTPAVAKIKHKKPVVK